MFSIDLILLTRKTSIPIILHNIFISLILNIFYFSASRQKSISTDSLGYKEDNMGNVGEQC